MLDAQQKEENLVVLANALSRYEQRDRVLDSVVEFKKLANLQVSAPFCLRRMR